MEKDYSNPVLWSYMHEFVYTYNYGYATREGLENEPFVRPPRRVYIGPGTTWESDKKYYRSNAAAFIDISEAKVTAPQNPHQ